MNSLITMSQKELFRYEIIKKLINKEITGKIASEELNLSIRQIKNIKKRVIQFGIQGIIHKARGKSSNNKIPKKEIKEIQKILKEKYHFLGPTLACEKLEENHKIKLSREKIRQLMIEKNIWKVRKKKRNKEYRQWRPRKECFGQLIQFDGSYHKWFGKKENCLLASIDDATGKITHAKFDYNESVKAVSEFWKEYIQINGKPMNIYLDRFSTYKINHKNAVDNKDLMTQFQRMAKDLDLKLISANSPQAKGRIERLFGTLQDRLVKELKLQKITKIDQANQFLKKYIPIFNQKFSVIPPKSINLHKKINFEEIQKLDKIFAIQSTRKVKNDFTIQFKNKWYQLLEEQIVTICKKDKVLIEERLDDSIHLNLRNKYLNFIELPKKPEKQKPKTIIVAKSRKPYIPPQTHPWRNNNLLKRNNWSNKKLLAKR